MRSSNRQSWLMMDEIKKRTGEQMGCKQSSRIEIRQTGEHMGWQAETESSKEAGKWSSKNGIWQMGEQTGGQMVHQKWNRTDGSTDRRADDY